MKANEICSLLQTNYSDYNNDASTRILKEWQICNGRSVVDLAIIDTHFYAFEIKSDSDTLTRLPSQIDHYNRVFDYIIIVTGESHLKKVREIVPNFWGIWSISIFEGQIVKNIIRDESRNTQKDAFSIAQLLWKQEILDLLKKHDLHQGMATKRKWLLWEYLASKFTIPDLTEEVKYYLKSRENWKL